MLKASFGDAPYKKVASTSFDFVAKGLTVRFRLRQDLPHERLPPCLPEPNLRVLRRLMVRSREPSSPKYYAFSMDRRDSTSGRCWHCTQYRERNQNTALWASSHVVGFCALVGRGVLLFISDNLGCSFGLEFAGAARHAKEDVAEPLFWLEDLMFYQPRRIGIKNTWNGWEKARALFCLLLSLRRPAHRFSSCNDLRCVDLVGAPSCPSQRRRGIGRAKMRVNHTKRHLQHRTPDAQTNRRKIRNKANKAEPASKSEASASTQRQ